MKLERVNSKKLHCSIKLDTSRTELFPIISEPHHLSQWLGHTVQKTSKGFDVGIKLPLYEIEISATILKTKPPSEFEFMWKSEYVMGNSIVTINLKEDNSSVIVEIEETGDFDESRWSDPQEIHLDLWKQALERLKKYIIS